MEYWIARSRNGSLSIFKDRPFIIMNGEWESKGEEFLCLDSKISFPEVTYENSPIKIKIELI